MISSSSLLTLSGGKGCVHPSPQPAGQFWKEEESSGAGERGAEGATAGSRGGQTGPAAGDWQGRVARVPLTDWLVHVYKHVFAVALGWLGRCRCGESWSSAVCVISASRLTHSPLLFHELLFVEGGLRTLRSKSWCVNFCLEKNRNYSLTLRFRQTFI